MIHTTHTTTVCGLRGRRSPLGRLLALLLLLGGTAAASAQQLTITKPFGRDASRNEAVTRPRIDFNHDTCALVIVSLDLEEADFEGDIKLMQLRDGEWWIYLSPGANWLTVLSEHHLPLRIEFAPVRPAVTYTLGIRAPQVLQNLAVSRPLEADITMVDASRFRRTDASGRTCALLRIGMVMPGARFSGAVASEYRRGEWWVWMSPGTTTSTVSVDGFNPLALTFEPLQAATTYVMTIVRSDELPLAELEPEAPMVYDDDTPVTPYVEMEMENNIPHFEEPQAPKPQPPVVEVVEAPKVEAAPKEEATPKEEVAPKTEAAPKAAKQGWSHSAALKSALLPGLGQMGKGYVGSGIATLTGELILVGGAVGSYLVADHQVQLIRNGLSANGLRTARDNYNTARSVNIGCIVGASALYVYNIVRAGAMKPRNKGSLALAPALLPADGATATGLGLTLNF